MKHIYTPIIALSLLLITTPALAKKAPPKPAAFVELISPDADRKDDTRDAMFKVAFGKAAPMTHTIEEQEYSFFPEAVQPLGGDMFALVSMGYNEIAGHAQSGISTVHYLRKTAAGYKVVGEWMDIGVAGTFGQPALGYALTAKLGKNPYLVTHAGGTWQGYTCEITALTELTPTKPLERGSFASGYSNSGEMSKRKRQNLEGVIASAVPDYSFTVRFSGTRKFTQTWVRGEKEYTLKGAEEVPQC
jgi:hypothetical protein